MLTRIKLLAAAALISFAASAQTKIHHVEKGETLYGISKSYGVSIDEIISLNPSTRDGLKAGEDIVIPDKNAAASTNNTQVKQVAKSEGGKHTIASGETLYRIAANNGLTVQDLLDANPGLDALNYQAGTVITIPSAAGAKPVRPTQTSADNSKQTAQTEPVKQTEKNTPATTPSEATKPVHQPEPLKTPDIPVAEDDDNAAEEKTAEPTPTRIIDEGISKNLRDQYNIAVMLPFMLSEEKPSRQAEMFTDFYRGFLLAADTLSHKGAKINIFAYDTAGSLDTLKAILKRREIKDMQIFIAPEKDEMVDYLAANVDEEQAFIVNCFATKNNAHLNNPHVIQTNIPHELMYTAAMNAFIDEARGYTPVFISRTGATADKAEFTDMLKKRLADENIEFLEINFSNTLSDTDLENLDISKQYIFIPVSSSRNEFAKIVPAIKDLKARLTYPSAMKMFGYPEWLTFRGDMLDNLGAVNAMVYSRFYNDPSYYPTRRVMEKFRNTYNREMIDAVPSQAIFGYDVAEFVIRTLREDGGDFHIEPVKYEGLQTNFYLDDAEIDGLVNTSLVLIKFNEGSIPTRKRI